MLSTVVASVSYAPVVPVASAATRAAAPQMGFGKAELMGGCSRGRTQAIPIWWWWWLTQPAGLRSLCIAGVPPWHAPPSGRHDLPCSLAAGLPCPPRADLAKQQNPVLGYYDPLGLADVDLWGQGEEASIGARPCGKTKRCMDAARVLPSLAST